MSWDNFSKKILHCLLHQLYAGHEKNKEKVLVTKENIDF